MQSAGSGVSLVANRLPDTEALLQGLMVPVPLRVIGIALLCAWPHALRAQTPPVRPDSSARADSIARADSLLLERELARIRGERRPVGEARSQDARERDSVAGRRRSPRLRYDIMLATGSPYAEDEAGVTVRPSVALGVGAAAAWTAGGGYATSLAVRATTNAAVISENTSVIGGAEPRRSAGRVLQLDFMGALERQLGDRYAVRAGAGVAWLRGPSDVVPFRHGNNGRLQPTGEVGLSMRLTKSRPMHVTLAGQASRFGSATIGDPVREPGWVNRLLIGVRYGR